MHGHQAWGAPWLGRRREALQGTAADGAGIEPAVVGDAWEGIDLKCYHGKRILDFYTHNICVLVV